MTIESIDQLMQRAVMARRENRPSDALRHWTEAVRLVRESGSTSQLARALKGLGQIERDLGRRATALALYEEATELYRGTRDALALAHTVRHVGDIHQDGGDLDLAEPCYNEALAIYRNTEGTHPLDLANTVRPLATLMESDGRSAEARRLWEEARELYEAVGIEAGVRECEAHLEQLGP